MQTLVIGKGGLIGSSLERLLQKNKPSNANPSVIPWDNEPVAINALQNATRQFIQGCGSERWSIVWSAGTGNILSAEDELKSETNYLLAILDSLREFRNHDGVLFFISSAGAMYNPKTSQTIDEESEVDPITPYGRTKLKQEKLVLEFAKNNSFRSIIGRTVSVYGPKQNLNKPQGLISKLCISALTNKELEIFVPISTTRNYLYSGDVAKMIEHCLMMAHEDKIEFKNYSLIKILCNSESSSIASICKATEVVMRKKVLLRLKLSAKNQLYPPHFNIRSSVLPDLSALSQTTLIAGVGSVRNDVIQRIQNSN